MFRATRPLFAAIKPIKASTAITGLAPHPDPIPALKELYRTNLNILSTLPATSVYRQATEALTKHKLSVVEKAGDDVQAIESEFGQIVEVSLEEGKSEQGLIGKMVEWKSWEPLEHEAPPDQWRYFEPGNEEESLP
ncbi:ETC complex I subunit conserved region-domain-containing protein [Naematelia encephala]|uniref:ETC complex I subunit conserved region-domain-containing protein n=1 Tax=Naematelia encephala TaxID=71784 RepID=A0A1Y2AN46_9TREE|nr:ETC complex I subunit conserved region-domain-containing protein [Naematelia encephala]